jgi:hypothetical protein
VFADSNNFNFPSTAANQFSARSTGGVRFVTGIDTGGNPNAGVRLDSGSSPWQVLSDRHSKRGFEAVDERDVLARVSELPISTWSWKTENGVRHMGPMAQDFHDAFGLGPDRKSISTVDADGVALAAIQGLARENDRLRKALASQERRLRALERAGN